MSHGGELAGAVAASVVSHADVTELGAVLTGAVEGRRSDERDHAVRLGLAIQDLAIAKLAYSKRDDLNLQTIEL